ncbi:MAG: redox-sensing transcriptional repressor Rex [Desulfatiglans sp.]|jgi:redox-sensing transcriptional repressor|nr:redox-sensing transcriptional repressor Rex [Thermodesulfobacteriota bacterium]MEE4353025.1 redox-sensing transcriptional repressor Rex [Desulfatiglans sp.]
MTKPTKIPKATITRLSMYYRQLEMLESDGYATVSSEKLARLSQANPAQVRKDLGYFGDFGVRGVGYDVIELQAEIKRILAINRQWNLAIIGVGKLGSALLHHENLAVRGFRCVAIFDNDPAKISKTSSIGLKIRDIKDLYKAVKELDIEIGIITTPPSVAQSVADMLVESQVKAILNFSPTRIRVPDCCLVDNIDFTVKLDTLTYKLHHKI